MACPAPGSQNPRFLLRGWAPGRLLSAITAPRDGVCSSPLALPSGAFLFFDMGDKEVEMPLQSRLERRWPIALDDDMGVAVNLLGRQIFLRTVKRSPERRRRMISETGAPSSSRRLAATAASDATN